MGSPGQRRLWGTVVTAGLLALGFSRRPYSEPRSAHPELSSVKTNSYRAYYGEKSRGRLASSPSAIQAPGWKDILLRVYGNISEHRILLVAAGITFYGLLAIFPAIAAVVGIYGLFADPNKISEHLSSLSGVLPGGAMDVLRGEMNRIGVQGKGALGLAFIIGLVASLWSANSGTKSVFDALNIVYREDEKRGFVRLTLVALAFTVGAIVFILLALGLMIVVPPTLNALGFEGTTNARENSTLAGPGRGGRLAAGAGLSLRSEQGPSTLALGHLGQRCRGHRLARALALVHLVCREIRQLQQDLWHARRRDRLHGLDVALHCRDSDWGRARC